jgi:hypothetical protein
MATLPYQIFTKFAAEYHQPVIELYIEIPPGYAAFHILLYFEI